MNFKFSCCIIGVLATLLGCSQSPEIAIYQIPKQTVPQTHRMLGAIVPRGEQAWFFKVSGPRDDVEKLATAFESFIKSLKFSENSGASPTWELPEGWKQQAGDQLRFATIQIPSEKQTLELSISTLPWRGDGDAQATANINRWRGQLNLPRIGRSTISDQVSRVDYSGGTAMMVNLVGELKSSGMTPPFASADARKSGGTPPAAANPTAREELEHETPKGWVRGQGDSLSSLAYEVIEGSQQIKITVTKLSVNAGQLVPNVNRWRGQIRLPEATDKDIQESLKKLPVGDIEADYVELVGPEESPRQEAILGAIARTDESAWFVKLRGDANLARRERDNFEQFVKSLRFK